MDTNTLMVLDKFGTKLDGYIQVAAEKAGQGVEHFWPIYVRQQYIEGFAELAIWLVVAVGIVVSWVKLLKYTKEGNTDIVVPWAAANIVIVIVLLIITFTGAGQTLGQVFNPEYAALQQVMRIVK